MTSLHFRPDCQCTACYLRPIRKIKMTTSWTDYLLCQLSSDKNLSYLECLAPELLEPILEELNERSVDGLRAFSQASRTCRALASPYRFKPLRVRFDELVTSDSATVILSSKDDFKTLKIRNPCRTKLRFEPGIEDVLKAEKHIECIEYRPDEDWMAQSAYHNTSNSVSEVFRRSCPTITKVVVGLGFFLGYSPGWDREYRESTAVRRGCPVKRVQLSSLMGKRTIRTLASFQNLRHLTVHFSVEVGQISLMHPDQGRHAVREMYHEIEKIKEGIRLTQLDVVFYTLPSYVFGRCSLKDARLTISCKYIENNKKGQNYLLSSDNRSLEKMIARRWEVEKLYGSRVWKDYLGPHSCHWLVRSQTKRLRPTETMIELVTRVALLPSVLRPPEIKKFAQRGIFYV